MDIGKTERTLFIAFCAFIIIPLLYIGRSADAGSFTSWRWVFSGTGIGKVFVLLAAGILCAYFFSRLELSGRRAALFLFVLSLAAVLPLWSEPETVLDAARYFLQAKSLKEHGVPYFLKEWGNAIPAWTDMPLAPFAWGLLFTWFNEARLAVQALNSLLFALTILLTYLIGKKIWDEETGLNAGLFLLGIPFLLTQAPLMLVDVPAMFFLTLAIYAFLEAADAGGPLRTAAAALAIDMALFSKYSILPMLSIMLVISIVLAKQDQRKTIIRPLAVLIPAALLAGAVIALRFELFREQVQLLRSYQWAALGRWNEGFASMFLFQTHPFITGLAICGMVKAVREKDLRFLIAGWFAVLIVLLQIKRMRYVIPLLPLLVLTASYGLNLIKDRASRKFIALSAAATSLVIAWGVYLPFLAGTSLANLQHAGHYLDTLDCASVEVYAFPQKSSSGSSLAAIPILDYYTDKTIKSPQSWTAAPSEGSRKTSSLRFTWEMKKPDFYAPTEGTQDCVVLIASEAIERVPPRLARRELKRFDLASDVFKYQTLVTVYRKD